MNRSIQRIFLFSLLLSSLLSCDRRNENTICRPVEELAHRLLGSHAQQIVFAQILPTDSCDSRYTIHADRQKVRISGTDRSALAVGLRRYLSEVCHVYISPYAMDTLSLPDVLPLPRKELRGSARTSQRFFLNYCTFGYTTAYWKWSDWERFIDWMALNGVNMPLAITGQEKVWLKVWSRMGLEPDSIRSYFTGPAHLPWHRMNNLDRWEGPLPAEWIEQQAILQQKILERERSLGMTPVLPAFSGHVPLALKEKFPDAPIQKLGEWGGFDKEYAAYYLHPSSPLFSRIQELFLQEQTKLYGTDHIYGIDAFNEVDSPDWSPEYLASVADAIYSSLSNEDPNAHWLMMGWLFYYDRKHWTPERIEAFLTAVPTGRILLLDYFCDKAEVWRETKAFHGQPYLWCYLGNFGGNTWLCGHLDDVYAKLEKAFASDTPPQGIGGTLESLDSNPIAHEYLLAQAWSPTPTPAEWIDRWALSHGGAYDPHIREAWELLYKGPYSHATTGSQGVLIHSRPVLNGSAGWSTTPWYNYPNEDIVKAWKILIDSDAPVTSSVRFDLVNVGRQALGNLFLHYRDLFTKAYEQKDLRHAQEYGERMLRLIDDYDSLLGYEPSFSLEKWIEDARSHADSSVGLSDYYERNARSILTAWGQAGGQLTEYANRGWAGLVRSYYAPRWERFVKTILSCLENGETFDAEAFREEMVDFEDRWRKDLPTILYPSSRTDLRRFARQVHNAHFGVCKPAADAS